MKQNLISPLLVLVLTGLTAQATSTGYDLGDAANYGVIFQGGGGNKLNVNNGPGLNGLAVNGNVGIAGTGALQLSGPLVVNANVDFAGAVVDNGPYSGNIVVNGVISGGHINVQNDMNNLSSLSTLLGTEAGTSIALNSGDTVHASAGTLDAAGNRVFNVNSVNLPNGTLTINGDGTHNVVLNFSSSANIHANNIVLTGGITSDQVLFNFFGGTSGTLSGGPTLDINSNFSGVGGSLAGTFLDPYGMISMVNAVLNGRIYGGDSHDEAIVSGALVNTPSITQVPDGGSTLLMISMGFGALAAAKKKFVR